MVLGLVQRPDEFLPVSSSGHLILVPHVFGWPDQGLAVDAGPASGHASRRLLAYFRGEIFALFSGALDRRLGVIIRAPRTIPGRASPV